MELNLGKYRIKKTKSYIKKNDFFFIFNGITRNVKNKGIYCEQELKRLNFYQYKIFNKTSKNLFIDSVFKNSIFIINSIVFFMKSPKINYKEFANKEIFENFKTLLFTLIGVKINNKIYSSSQLENVHSFKYYEAKLLLYQFNIKNVKYCVLKSK